MMNEDERKENDDRGNSKHFQHDKRSTSNSPQKVFVCDTCGKKFSRKGSMIHHQEIHNSNNDLGNKSTAEKTRPYSCNICDKKFTAKKNLLKHLRVIHKDLNEAEKLQVKKTRCPEKNCAFTCRKVKDLRIHIEKSHEIKILKDTLQFSNEAEFQKWKKEEESNSVSWFVAFRRKSILSNGNKKQTLSCHRTGQYNPKGAGKHKLKSHGSCKIGRTCPAAMEVTEFQDGQLSVVYYKTHLGHSQEVVHLQLTREERAKLLERIEQGFSLDAILEDIKESVNPSDDKPKRIHLLSRKDLYNIMQSFNNKKAKGKHQKNYSNDSKSDILNKAQEGISIEEDEESETSERQITKEVNNQEFEGGSSLMENPTYSNHDRNYVQLNSSAFIPDFNSTITQYHRPISTGSKEEASQVVIVSPNLNYRSVTEVILVQPTENLTPLTESNIFGTETVNYEANSSSKIENGNISEDNKTRTKSSGLTLKLQEKMEQIFQNLPKSEFLTPKQFELINSKLDSVINIYNSVKVKTKSKKLNTKKSNRKSSKQSESWDGNVVTLQENPVQGSVQQSPIYAYLCNFN